MQRWYSILLILWFAALGSGAVMYVHELDHERQDNAMAEANRARGLPPSKAPEHDDSNCEIHAQLHMPILLAGWVPLIVFLGLWVAFVSELPAPVFVAAQPRMIWSRGPPRA